MVKEGFKRKLAAILSADVKGYSRLMEDDEEATIHTISEYRKIITEQVMQHEGRVVDSPGDNVLADFASVVGALKCAVQTQKKIAEQNENLPDSRKMEFRIGINLGDIAEDGDRIYGDGVNVAARIEGLAEGGGICISRTAYDQVKNKLDLGFEYLGEQTVKNISEPVRVYRILMEAEAAGKVSGEKTPAGKKWRSLAIAAVTLLIVSIVGIAAWTVYLHQSKKVEAASIDKMAYPLPDKPSIAVMPFVNLSGDPAQDHLTDSISENLIFSLSQLPKVFVIARGSTFTYKARSVKIRQVSEELGVQYVVEGSVQRSGNRIRITAQLIDAIKGYHVWGNRYDRAFKDIFALQDDITLNILKAIQLEVPKVFSAGLGRGTNNLEAYLKFLRGYDHSIRSLPESFQLDQRELQMARRLFEDAIELDPEYAKACFLSGQFDRPIPFLEEAARRGPDSYLVLGAQAMAYSLSGRRQEAENMIPKYCKICPTPFTVEVLDWWIKILPFKNQTDRDRLRALNLEAGVMCDMPRSE